MAVASVDSAAPKEGGSPQMRSCEEDFPPSPAATPKQALEQVAAEESSGTKSRKGGWKAAPYIFVCGGCDFLSSYGVVLNMVPYLVTQLGLDVAEASTTLNNFMGMCSYTPLLGAFLADAYLGRYKTILIHATIFSAGLVWLMLTSILPFAHTPHCGKKQCLGILYSAFIVIAIGVGGIRPNSASFGADQFNQRDPKERKQLVSFFNWYYMTIVVAIIFSVTGLVYVQTSFGWGWTFGIPAGAMAVSAAIFWAGSPLYRELRADGSPFTRLAQVLVAATKRRHLALPEDPKLLYHEKLGPNEGVELPHTMQLRFLDKAATLTDADAEKPKASPWELCCVNQVEELKAFLKMAPIWITGVPVFIAWSQQGTLWIGTAMTMNLHMGPHFKIPPQSLVIFPLLTMLIFLPVYDRLVIPLAKKITGNSRGLTFLQRIGAGVLLTVPSMVVAGLVNVKQRNHPGLSVFWLVPQYCFLGLAEAFVTVGYLEFFYDQSPPSMRSMATAVVWAIIGTGNYLSTAIINAIQSATARPDGSGGWVSADGHLEYFHWLLAGIVAVDFVVHFILSRNYMYTVPDYGSKDDDVPIAMI